MLLKELVEVNQKGNVSNAVNFDLMDDPETNQDLCDSFIFNYDPKKPELSTVGILDRLKESFHSRNQPNIHMLIQQYGKGKSHFAVVLANFFGKPADSPEVQGILDQVDKATIGSSKVVGEKIKSYKARQQKHHLVLCLNGIQGGDIRKQFLQVLLKVLKNEGIEDSVANHLCSEPLRYLESLSLEDRAKAESYLESLGNPDGDVKSLIKLLKANNPRIISCVKEIFRHITGFSPNFQDDVNINLILRDLLENLCSGDNPHFAGILILFDEMNYYLQSWSANQIGAGGNALQNITEICEAYKSKIALLSFTQIHPSAASGISPSVKESYLKISSRLAPKESTYDEPASSLELVIANMLNQKEDTSAWKEFLHRWDDTLLSSARDAFEKRIKVYKQRGWTLDDFYKHLSRGCFPIHPIAAYLLCNLGFTQDRTAIQFIKKYVKQFIEEKLVEDREQLNYIYSIDLVDFFKENFSNIKIYNRYLEAEKVVVGSDNPDELKALKALFLYFACAEKFPKDDIEDHEEILGTLAGLPYGRIKNALRSLERTRDLIFYKSEIKLYRFYEGKNPIGIKGEIEDLVRNKNANLSSVVAYCNADIKLFLRSQYLPATQFIKAHDLREEDWQFELQFVDAGQILRKLSSTGKITSKKGLVLYILAETEEEINDLRRVIDDALKSSSIREKVVVAIPSLGVGNLPYVKLLLDTLKNQDTSHRRMWGTVACDQLEQRWEEEINTTIKRVLKTYVYYCSASEQSLNKFQKSRNRNDDVFYDATPFISALLEDLFPLVPTVGGVDKLRSDHNTGKLIVATVATQLFAKTLSPQTLPHQNFYKSVTENVYMNQWGILKLTTEGYIPQEPKNIQIKAAWQEISNLTSLGEFSEQKFALAKIWDKLSLPPYGYSEYNFVVLLAAWLAFHRKEVLLEGPEKINLSSNQLTSTKRFSLKEWANLNGDLFKDPKKFVDTWIVRCRAKLIRRKGVEVPEMPSFPIDFDQALEYLEKVNFFLSSTEAEPEDLEGVRSTKEKVEAALEPVYDWLQPVEPTEVLTNDAAIDTLLELHTQLRQSAPTYSLQTDVVSVIPTPDQRSRHDAANQIIATRIDQYIEQVSLRSETLSSMEACSAYETDVQNLLSTFQQTPNLPEHLQEILQNALQVAARVRESLAKNTQIKQVLESAQSTAHKLNDYSSQADFLRIINEIDALKQQIPTESPEANEIQLLLQNIDRQYQELNQKLDTWEERITSATTQGQIVALLQETAKYQDRFTDPESQERLRQLQERINRELAGIESKSQTETLLKAELDNARQYLQRLRDLPDARIGEAFQAFQELKGFQFTSVEDQTLLQQYQERLAGFKIQGLDQVTKRFQQICDRKLSRLDRYEIIKESLNRALSALKDAHDFEEIQANLTQSLADLETQAENLKQQAATQHRQLEDKQTFKEIQQLKPNRHSSIHACESALGRTQTLQANLHNPEQFQSEINLIIQACQDKIQNYKQGLDNLRDQLEMVSSSDHLNNLRLEYVRLEAAFHDSSEFDSYQIVGSIIEDINQDLQVLGKLESRYRQANSIATCNAILEDLSQLQGLLKYPERFRENRIKQLGNKTQQKIETYQQNLGQLEQQLTYASTPAEIKELQQKLLQQASCYANSNLAGQIDALNAEVETLISLLPLMDMAKAANLEACRGQIQKLTSWKDSLTDISQNIQERIDSALEELEKRQTELFLEKQESAQKWLQNLHSKAAQIQDAVRDSKKYEIAEEISKDIRRFKNVYVEFLDVQECKLLFEIQKQSLEEQNKHTGNQIITLFKQLSTSERKKLYQYLEQYLADQTEEDLSGKSEEGWWQKLFRSDNQKTNQSD
jgi:hypothetical protein